MAAGVFTGAALYVTFVEHPARVSCGPALAVTEFAPSYARASVMQAPLAIIGAATGTARWWAGGGVGWLIGAALLGSAVPFTLLVILPTNNRLVDPSLDKTSAEASALLARWARLHAVRSATSLLAFALFLALLIK